MWQSQNDGLYICECHLPLSEALNGTTYQWSGIRYKEEFDTLAVGLFAHKDGDFAGNWQ